MGHCLHLQESGVRALALSPQAARKAQASFFQMAFGEKIDGKGLGKWT